MERTTPLLESFLEKCAKRSLECCVVGLGYVGLPTAVELVRSGFHVHGVDRDERKLSLLEEGRSYIDDVGDSEVRASMECGRFRVHGRIPRDVRPDVFMICVPTPLAKTKEPDVSFVRAAARELGEQEIGGTLTILVSTSYPGTTREIVLPRLEEGGLRCGRDFFLAFSPERIDPGNKHYTTRNTPRLVGGIEEASGKAAEAFLATFTEQVHRVGSCEVAETAKLLENTFRSVNIALVNEMAMMCRRLGIDVWEVIDAASTKPYGYMRFEPGPGIGGHCIPVDPWYLSWKMRSLDFTTGFIDMAGRINASMPLYCRRRIWELLNSAGKPVKGSRLLFAGVSYKADVSDLRESPIVDLMLLCRNDGAEVAYHDPLVERLVLDAPDGRMELETVPPGAELRRVLEGCDLVVCGTPHRCIEWEEILTHSTLVFDTRNVMRKRVPGAAQAIEQGRLSTL